MPKNEILKTKTFYLYKNEADEKLLEFLESENEFQKTVKYLLNRYMESRLSGGRSIHEHLQNNKSN